MDILLLNGPNLNMLGTREPAQYGTQTLEDIVARIGALATDAGLSIEHHQDNSEKLETLGTQDTERRQIKQYTQHRNLK
jgi:3-dehydroquinate dehydratase